MTISILVKAFETFHAARQAVYHLNAAKMAPALQRSLPPYPEPYIVPPLRGPHLQTFIILHGRGSHGEKFGRHFLDLPIPRTPSLTTTSAPEGSPVALPDIYPHARFVFPTAAARRATLYKRKIIRQWFDGWDINTPQVRPELQLDGLRETTVFIHGLLRKEIAELGAANVILAGLSQGCAAALVAGLLWEGPAFAGFFGMCGYLPLAFQLETAMGEDEDYNQDDPFASDGEVDGNPSTRGSNEDDNSAMRSRDECRGKWSEPPQPAHKSLKWLSEGLGLERSPDRIPFLGIPKFLGHGVQDEKVKLETGRAASHCLDNMGAAAEMVEYDNLEHWYSAEMLRDIVKFLEARVSWKVAPDQTAQTLTTQGGLASNHHRLL